MRLSRRNALRAGGSVAAGLALAGCSGSSDDGNAGSPTGTANGTDDGSSVSGPTRDGEWPQDRYDAANSGAIDVGVSGSVSERWRVEEFSGGGYDPGTVRVHQGVVMVSTADGMFAYDAGTGSELWQSDVGYDNHVAIDGTVYQGTLTDDGEEVVAAYSVDDGSRTGELAVGGEAAKPLAVDENHVYAPISTGDGTELAAIDHGLNEIVWRDSYGSTYDSYISPAVSDGVVYIYREVAETEVVAYDAETGDQLWTYAYDFGIDSGPVVGAGAVYVDETAIDATTGEERWTTEIEPSDPVSPAAVTDEAVVYTGDGFSSELSVQAVDPDTGDRRWRRAFEWDGIGWPIVGNGTVYVPHTSGVTALSLSDGSTAWTAEIEPSALLILDDMLVVTSESDVVAYTP